MKTINNPLHTFNHRRKEYVAQACGNRDESQWLRGKGESKRLLAMQMPWENEGVHGARWVVIEDFSRQNHFEVLET